MTANTPGFRTLVAAGAAYAIGVLGASADDLSSVDVSGFDSAAQSASADFSAYSSVYVEAIGAEVEPNESNTYNPREGFSDVLSQTEIDRQGEELRERFEKRIGDKLEIASGRGAGVLVVDATLTELVPSRPTLQGLTQEPQLSLAGSVGVGGASVRIDIVDGDTGEVLAQLEDRNFGIALNDGRPRVGIWADAQFAYRRWSRSLANYLEDLMGEQN